jgi:ABC-2 type transport system ATP-binding protein
MIRIQELCKDYGDHRAVDHVSFEVKPGEILGFLGPNGAGKTTTMRMITGVLPPTHGTAEIDGFDITQDPLEVKKRIGYLPETPPVYLDFSVEAYLRFVVRLKGVPAQEQEAHMAWAMDKCSLNDVRKRMIGNLSKGYRQRVGLAGAIVHKPKVLILDEPTVGLDPKQIREIRSMIQELSQEHTIILSTHILPEVSMICDRAVFIHQGQLRLQGSIADLTAERSLEEVFMDMIVTEKGAA